MYISQTLARYVRDMRYEDLPDGARQAAKRSIIDTLAVAIGAIGEASSAAISSTFDAGGASCSSSWADGRRLSRQAATFANSALAATLDFDSLHAESVIHPDIVIVPAAFAVAESQRSNGAALLTAVAVGDDVLCRIGCATRGNSGWFYTSLYGASAAAMVTAKLLGADERRIAGAMGLGFVACGGTQQPAVERSVGKRLQAAFAASNGVQAGLLGQQGLIGPLDIFEGAFGFFRMYESGNPGVITAGLGREFRNADISYKAYPSCQCNHAAIEAVAALREKHRLQPDDIDSINVSVSPYTARLVGSPFAVGSNPQVDAQFSIQYSIASVLVYGKLGIGEIQERAIRDGRIDRLVRKIHVTTDAENAGLYAPVTIEVRTRHGTAHECVGQRYTGDAESPMTDRQLREKFGLCIEAAGFRIGEKQVDDVVSRIEHLEEEPDVSIFLAEILAGIVGGKA